MRKIGAFAAAALAVSAIVGPAGATAAAPITGTISCSVSGTITTNLPLTNTPSVKAIKVKGAGTATACNNSAVAGGKAPITAATIKISGSLPVGASCATLVNPAFGPTKVQVKFQGLNPSNKLMTVAVDNTTLASTSINLVTLTLQMVTAPILKGAFVGQTITLNEGIDGDPAALLAACGGAGISSLTFGQSNPSSVTSP